MAERNKHMAASVGFLDRTPVQKARKMRAKKKNLAQKPWRNVVNISCKKIVYFCWEQ
jgi:hypothetical protein